MPANYRQAANLVRYAKPVCGFGDAIWRAGIVVTGDMPVSWMQLRSRNIL